MNLYRILVRKSERKNHYKDQDIGGWTILKWDFREVGWGCMEWTDVAYDRDKWRVPVNTIRNLRVP
jgi:hypothetical protein